MPAVQKNKLKKKTRKFLKGPRQLKLKGWLKTPEQWNKFNEWVKVNGLPRKVPEVEPIVREAKPLGYLKKRLAVLAAPAPQPASTDCVAAPSVSRAALAARPTKRIKRLARPHLRLGGGDDCRDPLHISPAALRYKPSTNILQLALPSARHEPGDCSQPAISRAALKHRPTPEDVSRAQPKLYCQELCQQPWRFRCHAPEMTPWMEFLALPSWRVLKDQKSENAQKWKKQILEETEPRAKEAYEEQQRKRQEQKKLEEEEKRQRQEEEEKKKQKREAEGKKQEEAEEEKKTAESQPQKSKTTLASGNATSRTNLTNLESIHSTADAISEDEYEGEEGEWEDTEDYGTETAERAMGTPTEEQQKESKKKCTSRPKKKFGPAKKCKEGDKECEEKEKKKAEERKKAQNAWRFSDDGTCKENPPKIPKAALKYEASQTIREMANPKVVKSITCRKDPYKIKESALKASATPGIEELAKPKHTCDPVKRPPPREYDDFGQPIIPKLPYGKKLPEPKPYPLSECPKKDEEQKAEEKEPMKKRDIVLVFAPTIDPLFDPTVAARQARQRAKYKEELENAKSELSDTEETSGDKSDNEKSAEIGEKSTATSQKSDVDSLKSAKSSVSKESEKTKEAEEEE